MLISEAKAKKEGKLSLKWGSSCSHNLWIPWEHVCLFPSPPHVMSAHPPMCGVSGVAGPRLGDEKQSAAELDLVLQQHQNLQEKLAEEMLGLARSLKTNTLAAQSVIKKDNQV